jgi:DNA-binding MarR family transcriptional regulator
MTDANNQDDHSEGIDRRAVAGQLMYLQGLLRRLLAQGPAGQAPWADPSRGQGRVLALLRLTPEVTQKDIGYLLGLSKQAAGELLGKLQQRGFIEREQSATDRRVVIVRLTDAGRAAANDAATPPDAGGDQFGVLDCLEDEEGEKPNNHGRPMDDTLFVRKGGRKVPHSAIPPGGC